MASDSVRSSQSDTSSLASSIRKHEIQDSHAWDMEGEFGNENWRSTMGRVSGKVVAITGAKKD